MWIAFAVATSSMIVAAKKSQRFATHSPPVETRRLALVERAVWIWTSPAVVLIWQR
jgi:hypothetical protein